MAAFKRSLPCLNQSELLSSHGIRSAAVVGAGQMGARRVPTGPGFWPSPSRVPHDLLSAPFHIQAPASHWFLPETRRCPSNCSTPTPKLWTSLSVSWVRRQRVTAFQAHSSPDAVGRASSLNDLQTHCWRKTSRKVKSATKTPIKREPAFSLWRSWKTWAMSISSWR